MTEPVRYFVTQVSFGPLPRAVTGPVDMPELAELADRVRSAVPDNAGVHVATFIADQAGERQSLLETIRFHRLLTDGSCRCGWPGGSEDEHAEHVASTFEDSVEVRASA